MRKLFMLLFVLQIANTLGAQTTVPVKDIRKEGKMPRHSVTEHKAQDVDVYRYSAHGSEGYEVIYYKVEKDTLRTHAFMVVQPVGDFDKATYTWNNDTVKVRLYNATTQKSKTFKGFGYGDTSGMSAEN